MSDRLDVLDLLHSPGEPDMAVDAAAVLSGGRRRVRRRAIQRGVGSALGALLLGAAGYAVLPHLSGPSDTPADPGPSQTPVPSASPLPSDSAPNPLPTGNCESAGVDGATPDVTLPSGVVVHASFAVTSCGWSGTATVVRGQSDGAVLGPGTPVNATASGPRLVVIGDNPYSSTTPTPVAVTFLPPGHQLCARQSGGLPDVNRATLADLGNQGWRVALLDVPMNPSKALQAQICDNSGTVTNTVTDEHLITNDTPPSVMPSPST